MSRRTLGTVKHIDPGKQANVITTRGDLLRGNSAGVPERLAVGTTPEFLGNNGTDVAWEALPTANDTTAGVLETATQAEQETGTATDKIVTSGRQNFHPSAAKAWVNANVDGTTDVTHNVSGATDVGAGLIGISFSTAFSTVEYVALVSGEADDPAAATNQMVVGVDLANRTASRCDFFNADTGGTIEDPVEWNMVFFGDQ